MVNESYPPKAPVDEDGFYTAGSWVEDGQVWHQIITRLLHCPDDLRAAVKWCRTNAPSLVNHEGIESLSKHAVNQGHNFVIVMIFADEKDAIVAKLMWG